METVVGNGVLKERNIKFKELKNKEIDSQLALFEQEGATRDTRFLALNERFGPFAKEGEKALLSLVYVGQAPYVFHGFEDVQASRFTPFLDALISMDAYFAPIGGIAGYHYTVLEQTSGLKNEHVEAIEPSKGVDLGENRKATLDLAFEGLKALEKSVEIFPVGGLGDRLKLKDPNGNPLPVAMLPFMGRTLLEGLFRDLEGREALFAKRLGKKTEVPVVLMTSFENNNDQIIRGFLKDKNYFGRTPESIHIVTQPSVPVVTKEGIWSLKAPFELNLKPGGHGAIWPLLMGSGHLDRFISEGREYALFRQINNPLGGLDCNLLSLAGFGVKEDKSFGFLSCERAIGSAEGMLVVKALKDKHCLTNIEYTEFEKWGIEDKPKKPGSPFSRFPSNTNILFANLKRLKPLIEKLPFPGMTLNFKTDEPYFNLEGKLCHEKGGRLEAMMQSLADQLYSDKNQPLQAFVLFNKREKTLSVTKRSFQKNGSLAETPEQAFLDLQGAYRDILEKTCGLHIENPETAYLDLSPKLGPIYEEIANKIKGGVLKGKSALILDGENISLKDVSVNGVFKIQTKTGACALENVDIHTEAPSFKEGIREGIDTSAGVLIDLDEESLHLKEREIRGPKTIHSERDVLER